jgi:hypothetical protein
MPLAFINPGSLLSTPTYSHSARIGATVYCAGVVGLDEKPQSSPDLETPVEKAYVDLRILVEGAVGGYRNDPGLPHSDRGYRDAQGHSRSAHHESRYSLTQVIARAAGTAGGGNRGLPD